MHRNRAFLVGVALLFGCADADDNIDEQEPSPSQSDPGIEDGVAKPKSTLEVDFQCRAFENNAGCSTVASCPDGTAIYAIKAACNLEYDVVSDADVDGTYWGALKIVRQSDNVKDGICTVNGYGFVHTSQATTGAMKSLVTTAQSVTAACNEHDKNGADCEIRGILLCE